MAEGFLHLLCAINRYILYLGNTTLIPRDDGDKKPVPGSFEVRATCVQVVEAADASVGRPSEKLY